MSDFQDRARAEAERRYRDRAELILAPGAIRNARMEAFERGALWATQAEPTEAEVLAALNTHESVLSPRSHPAPSLDYYGTENVAAMRAAITAFQQARKED